MGGVREQEAVGVARVRAALESGLSSGDPAISRMLHADTSVAFQVEGSREQAALRLDGESPEVVPALPDAEIVIDLSAGDAARFVRGALSMTDAVASGRVATDGPVRRYLEVDPILRRLLASQAGIPRGRNGKRVGMTTSGPIESDLLAIETRDLHKRFGTNRVLSGLSIGIPEGVISVVLGPSGTGKSVLLQHVIGLMEPDRGDVLVRGRNLGQISRRELLDLRRGIGVMFQDGALFSDMDVYDNVAFPLRQHTDMHDGEVDEIVMKGLASVGLTGAVRRMPNELSGGMRKRAGLARALVLDPGIILCDEPDSGLDPVRTALLGDLLIEQHAEHGGTMVVVTHNVGLARLIADHINVVWQGEVLESGAADVLFESGTEFVRQFLGGETKGPLGMDA